MIVLEGVSKFFGSKKAVNNITFEAKEGDIIGFLGLNGAGKTTTMRLILGYLKSTEGTISVNGYDPINQRIDVLRSVGYLPENNPLYTDMKVGEYLNFVKEVKKSMDSIEDIAEEVGLEDRLASEIEELSRGYRQRVGLAGALISDPDILILDEPTSGLDPIEQDKIRDLIKKRAKTKTTIFSTHILSEVEDIASRLVVINGGKMVYDDEKPKGKGSVEKLFKELVNKS